MALHYAVVEVCPLAVEEVATVVVAPTKKIIVHSSTKRTPKHPNKKALTARRLHLRNTSLSPPSQLSRNLIHSLEQMMMLSWPFAKIQTSLANDLRSKSCLITSSKQPSSTSPCSRRMVWLKTLMLSNLAVMERVSSLKH
mgnify:CR=1 FL=1